MLKYITVRTTLLSVAAAMALLFFSATPASAQAEQLLSPAAASYALAVAGVGFLGGYSAAPYLVRVWMDRARNTRQ